MSSRNNIFLLNFSIHARDQNIFLVLIRPTMMLRPTINFILNPKLYKEKKNQRNIKNKDLILSVTNLN